MTSITNVPSINYYICPAAKLSFLVCYLPHLCLFRSYRIQYPEVVSPIKIMSRMRGTNLASEWRLLLCEPPRNTSSQIRNDLPNNITLYCTIHARCNAIDFLIMFSLSVLPNDFPGENQKRHLKASPIICLMAPSSGQQWRRPSFLSSGGQDI